MLIGSQWYSAGYICFRDMVDNILDPRDMVMVEATYVDGANNEYKVRKVMNKGVKYSFSKTMTRDDVFYKIKQIDKYSLTYRAEHISTKTFEIKDAND